MDSPYRQAMPGRLPGLFPARNTLSGAPRLVVSEILAGHETQQRIQQPDPVGLY
jgi:hypothetical protein